MEKLTTMSHQSKDFVTVPLDESPPPSSSLSRRSSLDSLPDSSNTSPSFFQKIICTPVFIKSTLFPAFFLTQLIGFGFSFKYLSIHSFCDTHHFITLDRVLASLSIFNFFILICVYFIKREINFC